MIINEPYLIKKLIVPEVVNIVFQQLLKGFNQDLKRIFCHIYKTAKVEEERFVPISSYLFTQEFGRNYPDWRLLEDANLIERRIIDEEGRTYSKERGLSNEFRLTEPTLELILLSYPLTVDDFMITSMYEVITNKKTKERIKNVITDKTGHPIPKLLVNAMKSIKPCPYNVKAVVDHLSNLRDENYNAYLNDSTCHNNIMQQIVEKLNDESVTYQAHYKPQSTGRLSELGGGLMSCSREMKLAAVKDVPNVHNYDLESSQVLLLVQFLEAANINCAWLKEYLTRNKQEYADRVGISKDCWKQVLLTLIMGGHLPDKVNTNKLKQSQIDDIQEQVSFNIKLLNLVKQISNESINIYLLKEFKGDFKATEAALVKLRLVVQDLNNSLTTWHNWLLEVHIPLVSIINRHGQSLTNKSGMSFDLEPYKEKGLWTKDKKLISELKSKVAAFLLQGAEAAFIHTLTYLSNNYEFDCINNQHDGLLTISTIPLESIELAIQQSGLKYAKLIEKSII